MDLCRVSPNFLGMFKIYTQYPNDFFIVLQLFFETFIDLFICSRAMSLIENGLAKTTFQFLVISRSSDHFRGFFRETSTKHFRAN